MINLKKYIFIPVFIFFFSLSGFSHEGMWLPNTLKKLVEGDMQANGLKLSADQIYSINESSLKDAIVLFGGGCTAEVISDEGLILTNHHCGYSQIQAHSSLENDYLKDGFWAMDRTEELSNPGLTATFVIRIENVTTKVLGGAQDADKEVDTNIIEAKIKQIEQDAEKGTSYKAQVKPFYYGNEYYLIVTETYNDVRMVGAPPSSIGKFGGDTDNWMWPRHTGDFALFRIYASAENEPADYSEDNIPYSPKYSLPISMNSLEPGDFTMVFGFPGKTDQYLSSSQVKYITEVSNPAKIKIRKLSLEVIDKAMAESDETRIKYAAKQSRISNAYKKWIGQNMGLKRFDAVEKKQKQEEAFMKLVNASPESKEKYGSVLSDLDNLTNEFNDYKFAMEYFIEMYYYGPEILRFAGNFNNLAKNYEEWAENGTLDAELEKLKKGAASFFKNYDQSIDRALMQVMMPQYYKTVNKELSPDYLAAIDNKHKGDFSKFSDDFYKDSFLDNQEEVLDFLSEVDKKKIKKLRKDPALKMANAFIESYLTKIKPEYELLSQKENALMKVYIEGMMKLMDDEKYWPDANSTMRLTYGKAEGSSPADGVNYQMYTTLEGVMDKYIPGDKEFDVPEKLIELYENADYGSYATNGEMRVCFLGSNHTTGGNSGSPAINANGELVGLNFDRTWESTMSDIMFDPEICRNIMVDIKYVLFIIDKFAGAGHLIQEMELVNVTVEEEVSN